MIPVSPISPTFTVWGITLYTYGVIIGIAVLAAVKVMELFLKKSQKSPEVFMSVTWLTLIVALVWARLWHILTDFHLYQNNLMAVFQLRNGGMSIVGALLGGALAVPIALKLFDTKKEYSWKYVFDIVAFGLPVGQIIGRLGNYVNQELYGLPLTSDVPWKLAIDDEYRLSGYATYHFFHPLFLYESIAMLLFFFVVVQFKKKQLFTVGSGVYALLYIWFYSCVRYILDFFRIDTAIKLFGLLGINQVFFLSIFLISTVILYIYVAIPRFKRSVSV